MDNTEILHEQIARARRLRASGPTTIDYLRWRDDTNALLSSLMGPDAEMVTRFREALGPYDALDAEGIQIDGEHGMQVRIERAETLLRTLLGADD